VHIGHSFTEIQSFLGKKLTAVHHDKTAPKGMSESISYTIVGGCFREFCLCNGKSLYGGMKTTEQKEDGEEQVIKDA
jgi:hypothetical protein